MKLELHHFFILVEPEAKVAESVVALGFNEGTRNTHDGQGTSNRRFYFSNGMLEFLWVHDEPEATNGSGRNLLFPDRAKNPRASPFGVIFNSKDKSSRGMPFEGWKYQPEYLAPPQDIHVGVNSSNLLEPLCLYMPFLEPIVSTASSEEGRFNSISKVKISTPSKPASEVLAIADTADRFSIGYGNEHLMEITFHDGRCGLSEDLRPAIPLVINW